VAWPFPNSPKTKLMAVSSVKLLKTNRVPKFQCNQTLYPLAYGSPLLWILSQTFQNHETSILCLLLSIASARPSIIITPCRKSITAEETAQLYLDNIWRRTGLPQHVISDRGPQFAFKLMCEIWSKLNVNQALFTAFHPQTDREIETLIRKSNSSFGSSAITKEITGLTCYPLLNLHITFELIQPPDTLLSKSGIASNLNSYP
jgi:hypothetical protein